jgi:signal transduction histidine kinase/DNA-binding response OmpR family regulator
MAAEILVVDDSRTQLEALRALLEDAAFTVHTARSGEAALERMVEGGIDLVLSDVVMPGMSGYELCAAIKRELGADKAPPIVLLTSLSDPADIVRGLECGADNYITKPYDPEHLVARIEHVLENRQLRRGRPAGERVSIRFMGETFTVGADREQILDLLLSSFEELVRTNDALQESKRALADAHARELEHEQEARAQAEHSARRMELLARASAALSASLDEQAAVNAIAELVIPVLADACVIDTIAEDGAHTAAVAHCEESGRVLLQRVMASSGGLGPWADLTSADEPAAIDPLPARFFEEAPVDEETRAALAGAGLRAALLAAMTARGRRLGTLALLRTGGAEGFTREDVTHANELANRVALAIDNVRLFRQAERDRAAAEEAAASIAALYDSERHARGEAEAATRVRDEVLAIVSHDLRNPLGIIFTGTSLLLELPLTEEQRTHQLQVLKRAAQRMERLIADLLEVSHLESGRLTLERHPNPVRELINEAQDAFAPLANEKDVRLVAENLLDAGTVHVDRERILQVFSNLVGNAIKFTPAGGTITISAEPLDDEVTFCVEDTGPGIAAEDLPRIFDRFWQARKTAHAGTGLGLAIAKGIVEAHDGRIWATSEEGVGSRFFFAVPRTVEA